MEISLSEQDNEFLTQGFSMEEIKDVVFSMEHSKASGRPDGFPIEFYQNFWEIVNWDLKELFDDFHKGELDDFHKGELSVERLNYGIITLVPKSKDCSSIQKYRPLCVLNVSFKILAKAITVRMAEKEAKVVSNTQTAFIKNRYIMEGILVVHEVHDVHRKKKCLGFFSKLILRKPMIKLDGLLYTKRCS